MAADQKLVNTANMSGLREKIMTNQTPILPSILSLPSLGSKNRVSGKITGAQEQNANS